MLCKKEKANIAYYDLDKSSIRRVITTVVWMYPSKIHCLKPNPHGDGIRR